MYPGKHIGFLLQTQTITNHSTAPKQYWIRLSVNFQINTTMHQKLTHPLDKHITLSVFFLNWDNSVPQGNLLGPVLFLIDTSTFLKLIIMRPNRRARELALQTHVIRLALLERVSCG